MPSEAELRKVLGDQFQAARIARGLSREAVAALADIPFKTVGNIERGEAKSWEAWLAYAKALDVRFGDLMTAAENEYARR